MSVSEYKQVIILRQDLRLPKGKAAAQCAHASVEAVLRSAQQKTTKATKSHIESLKNLNLEKKQKVLDVMIFFNVHCQFSEHSRLSHLAML